MKNIFLLILFFTSIANAQQYEKIDLRWKINDTLTYETIMKDVFVKQNVSESETDSIFEERDSFFKDIQKQRANLKYETKLFPDKNYDII